MGDSSNRSPVAFPDEVIGSSDSNTITSAATNVFAGGPREVIFFRAKRQIKCGGKILPRSAVIVPDDVKNAVSDAGIIHNGILIDWNDIETINLRSEVKDA